MIAWNGYYDASRTQNDPTGVLLTVGIASTENKWLRMEREWKRDFLKVWNIPYLHMKEFFVGPAFQHIRAAGKEVECLECATRIIKARTHLRLGVGVHLEAWRAVDKTYRLSDVLMGPYPFVTGLCADRIAKWIREKHGNVPMLHIAERGDLGQGVLLNALRGSYLPLDVRNAVDPVTGEWFVPFQATDLLAWVMRRVLEDNKAGKRLSPIAHMVVRLLQPKDMIYDTEPLMNWFISHPEQVPLRITPL